MKVAFLCIILSAFSCQQNEKEGELEPAPQPPVVLETITNSLGMEFVLIPSGSFMMGTSDSENGAYRTEKPQHRVEITKPFYIG